MQELRTVTIDTLRPRRRAIGAGVLYVGHVLRGLRPAIEKALKHGRTNTALMTIVDQKKPAPALLTNADERPGLQLLRRGHGESHRATQWQPPN
jgi:hypothetical protein